GIGSRTPATVARAATPAQQSGAGFESRVRFDQHRAHPACRRHSMTQAESGLIRTNEESQADGVHAMRPSPAPVPLLGKFIDHFLPVRRETVLRNLRRAFPDSDDAEIRSLAQASYGHLALSIGEFARGSLLRERRSSVVRIEGREAVLRAAGAGKGMLVLT